MKTKPSKAKYVYPIKGGWLIKIGATSAYVGKIDNAYEIAVEIRDRFMKKLGLKL